MRYTVGIGTYLGVPVRVHFTFPLILLFFGGEALLREGLQEAVWTVTLVSCVFLCVVLHEFGHCLQARRFGVGVRDIVLLPIGGVARADRIPQRPFEEITVALAGPLVNFGIAAALLIVQELWGGGFGATESFANDMIVINVVLGVFNLTPAFPMDGGRILRGLLALRMPYVTATRHARNVGQLIALAFIVLGFYFTQMVMLPVIAIFIFWGAMAEEHAVRSGAEAVASNVPLPPE